MLALFLFPTTVEAKDDFLFWFNQLYGTTQTRLDSCSTCHTASGGFTGFGNLYREALRNTKTGDTEAEIMIALIAIEPLDSDGDGTPNGVEIAQRFHPGYTCANWMDSIFGNVTADFVDPSQPGCLPAPDINLNPPTLDFGNVQTGMTGTLTTAIENLGTADLQVAAVGLCAGTSAEYSALPAAPFTVPPGTNVILSVSYRPLAAGTDVGCLQVMTNDPDEPSLDLNVTGMGVATPTPDIQLNPAALNFGNVEVGMAGALSTAVQNLGNADLQVTMVNLCAGTSNEFSTPDAIPFIVSPGLTVPLNVSYRPIDTGLDVGCFQILTNDPDEAMVTLDLTGNGVAAAAPDINLNPPTLSFGNVQIGMSGALVTGVENLGNADLQVTMLNLCAGTSTEFSTTTQVPFVVPAGMSMALNVSYSPIDSGTDVGCFQLVSNDPDEPVVALNLSGTGVVAPTPDINLNPAALDFGNVQVGATGSLTTAVENLGTAELQVTMVNLCQGTSTEYGSTPAAPFTVAAGVNFVLTVTYRPTDTGIDPGCLQLVTNDPDEGTVALNLVGNGVVAPTPDINLNPAALVFGNVPVGTTASLSTAVENLGTAELQVSLVSFCTATSTEYAWTPSAPFNLAAGASLTLNVSYTPVAAGIDNGCLLLVSNDPDEGTIPLNLTGTGVAAPTPDINLNPAALDFGTVTVGMSATLATQVENLGNANLQVTAVSFCTGTSAEYGWTPAAPLTIAAGTSATLNVTYGPNNTGIDAGCLQVTSNDPDEGLVALNLTGNGAAPSGSRQPNTEIVITELPNQTPGSMQPKRVFSQLSFTKSVLLVELVDPQTGNGRLFQVSQTGVIQVFPNQPDPSPADLSTYLDIRDRVLDSGEQGLLGLAFSPRFFLNGELYVYYSRTNPARSVVSRFRVTDPRSNFVDPATEEILLEQPQPFSNHNGGMIAFGPDGYLYIALGDGGSGGDPQNNGQNTETLLGSILRIDVDSVPNGNSGLNYVIPPDNPFANGGPQANTRAEIFAYGLRNPYRFSFDQLTGTFYAADVGQNAWEEIDIIQSGGNYGWRCREGNHDFNTAGCPATGFIAPIAEYSHSFNGGGASVTGGYVYYGSRVPELYGSYVFGDYISRRVYSIRHDGQATTPLSILAETNLVLTGFGQDQSGEVYLLDYGFSGGAGIYVLEPETPPSGSSFPTRLSDLPALLTTGLGEGHTVPGVVPFDPHADFWSDGASSERYFALPDYDFAPPDYAQLSFRETGGWDLPDDSVLVKNFLLSLDARDPLGTRKRIETQLLYKHQGTWYGFSYEWNRAGTDALLLTSSKRKAIDVLGETGQEQTIEWRYLDRAQCAQCHTDAANRLLGLSTAQVNHDVSNPGTGVTENQLRALDALRYFDTPLPADPDVLPRMPDPADTAASLQDRARAYLAANCSMCHQPGGGTGTELDFRWETPNDAMNAIGLPPANGDLGIPNAEIVKPGDPAGSVLSARMASLDPDVRMPPLGTHILDLAGAGLLTDWILSLEGPAPTEPPERPTLISPMGVTLDFTPEFRWNHATGATGYTLWIGKNQVEVFSQLFAATDVCSGTICAVELPQSLTEGTHRWYVQGQNSFGVGRWSSSLDIQVSQFPAPPGMPSPISPIGAPNDSKPPFSWTRQNDATEYYLWVNDGSGNLYRQHHPATSICNDATCTVFVPFDLSEGAHLWYLQASNAAGNGPWTPAIHFAVSAFAAPPGAPVAISPLGFTSDTTPLFTWEAQSDATDYFLWVDQGQTNIYAETHPAASICNDITCSFELPFVLNEGEHRWYLQGINSAGPGPWNSGPRFRVGAFANPPGMPNPLSPTAPTADTTPVFSWEQQPEATEYFLWINEGAFNVYQQIHPAGPICDGTICRMELSQVLNEGAHIWWVQAKNSLGDSPWSRPLLFAVSPFAAPPEIPSLIGPSGTVSDTTPVFQWTNQSEATDYQIWINAGRNMVYNMSHLAAAICTGSTCSLELPQTLALGSHTWWLRGSNSAGLGPWSLPMTFVVSP